MGIKNWSKFRHFGGNRNKSWKSEILGCSLSQYFSGLKNNPEWHISRQSSCVRPQEGVPPAAQPVQVAPVPWEGGTPVLSWLGWAVPQSCLGEEVSQNRGTPTAWHWGYQPPPPVLTDRHTETYKNTTSRRTTYAGGKNSKWFDWPPQFLQYRWRCCGRPRARYKPPRCWTCDQFRWRHLPVGCSTHPSPPCCRR